MSVLTEGPRTPWLPDAPSSPCFSLSRSVSAAGLAETCSVEVVVPFEGICRAGGKGWEGGILSWPLIRITRGGGGARPEYR